MQNSKNNSGLEMSCADESPNAPCLTKQRTASNGCWAALPRDLFVRHLAPSLDTTSGTRQAARLVCRSWASGVAGACKKLTARGPPPRGWGKTFSEIDELDWSKEAPPLRGEVENLKVLKHLRHLTIHDETEDPDLSAFAGSA